MGEADLHEPVECVVCVVVAHPKLVADLIDAEQRGYVAIRCSRMLPALSLGGEVRGVIVIRPHAGTARTSWPLRHVRRRARHDHELSPVGAQDARPPCCEAACESLREQCEEGREEIRSKHHDAYISGCNSGEATLTTP